MNITVTNYKRGGKGRNIMRGRNILSNQFRIGRDGSREEVIQKYRRWLWDVMQIPNSAYMSELKTMLHIARNGSLELTCCCAPLPCHGDVIKAALMWLDKQ